MSLGLYDSERRHRRRATWRLIRVLFYLGLLLAAGLFAYQLGVEDGAGMLERLTEQHTRLEAELAKVKTERDSLGMDLSRQNERVDMLEKRIAAEVPTGDRRRLLEAIDRRLAAGVTADRLAFFVNSAAAPRDCAGVESKRFLVRTPLTTGPATSVSFANGAVTVTGEGESARDAEGRQEAWYDPAQPVSLSFAVVGGKTDVVAGPLPLHHAVLHGGAELRFSATAGERGFVRIAYERCAQP